MQTHVKIVALLNLLRGGLVLLGAAGVLLGGVFGSLFTEGVLAWLVISATSVVVAAVLAVVGAFWAIAGLALLNRAGWARGVLIVMALFGLFRWPMGTLVSAYTLWVLLHADTKRLFAAR